MSDKELSDEIAELKDLFLRRLLDDKSKGKLIDGILESQKKRDEFEKNLIFADLFKEALVALDRLMTEEPTKELIYSFNDELLEIFRRRGLVKVSTDGNFDSAIHEIVKTVPVSESFADNEIVDVQREGFMLGGRLLRPARVVIAKNK